MSTIAAPLPYQTLTPLDQDAMRETLADANRMINAMVQQLAFAHKVTFEELISVAHEGFVHAFESYTPGKGTRVTSWCYFVANKKCLNYLRKTRKHRGGEELNEQLFGSYVDRNFMAEFLEGLSADAQHVARLLVESNDDMQVMLAAKVQEKRAADRNEVKHVLREHLLDIGWSSCQIVQAFREIKNALQ